MNCNQDADGNWFFRDRNPINCDPCECQVRMIHDRYRLCSITSSIPTSLVDGSAAIPRDEQVVAVRSPEQHVYPMPRETGATVSRCGARQLILTSLSRHERQCRLSHLCLRLQISSRILLLKLRGWPWSKFRTLIGRTHYSFLPGPSSRSEVEPSGVPAQ